MPFVSSSSHRRSAARPKNHASLAKTFSPGILVKSTCSNSIGFSARVPFRLGCRLFSSFEVGFETIGKKLMFYTELLGRRVGVDSKVLYSSLGSYI